MTFLGRSDQFLSHLRTIFQIFSVSEFSVMTPNFTKGDRANYLFILLLLRPQSTKGGVQIREKQQNLIL